MDNLDTYTAVTDPDVCPICGGESVCDGDSPSPQRHWCICCGYMYQIVDVRDVCTTSCN